MPRAAVAPAAPTHGSSTLRKNAVISSALPEKSGSPSVERSVTGVKSRTTVTSAAMPAVSSSERQRLRTPEWGLVADTGVEREVEASVMGAPLATSPVWRGTGDGCRGRSAARAHIRTPHGCLNPHEAASEGSRCTRSGIPIEITRNAGKRWVALCGGSGRYRRSRQRGTDACGMGRVVVRSAPARRVGLLGLVSGPGTTLSRRGGTIRNESLEQAPSKRSLLGCTERRASGGSSCSWRPRPRRITRARLGRPPQPHPPSWRLPPGRLLVHNLNDQGGLTTRPAPATRSLNGHYRFGPSRARHCADAQSVRGGRRARCARAGPSTKALAA